MAGLGIGERSLPDCAGIEEWAARIAMDFRVEPGRR
jgi:hypothetical protein